MFNPTFNTQTSIICFMVACLWGVGAATAAAQEPLSPEELWLETDLDSINEGELAFLPIPPKQPVHHLSNALSIDSESLDSGWVRLRQCHQNLDAVPDAEVVYRYREVRGLKVLSYREIGQAGIEGQSVQLKDVRRGAELCVAAEVRILERQGEAFVLRNGPFHRRFLDGYYPMHVTLTVEHPQRLQTHSVSPLAQPGFTVRQTAGKLELDAWFVGRLEVELRFSEAVPP